MSRHKLVKNLDLDDELDDFDGGEDYDDYGEEAEGEQYCRVVSVWVYADNNMVELNDEDKGPASNIINTYTQLILKFRESATRNDTSQGSIARERE